MRASLISTSSNRNSIPMLLLTALIAFGLMASGAGQVQQCADFNEYCQNHWDCCSNSCQSYRNRCTRNYVVFPYTFFGINYNYNDNYNYNYPSISPQPATLDDLLELNFGNELRRTRAVDQSSPEGGAIKTEENEVKKVEEETMNVADETSSNDIAETMESRQVSSSAGGVSVVVGGATTLAPPTCSPVGVKCYTNAECCTQRCHGFLHQCVT